MILTNLGRPYLLFLAGRLLVWTGGAIAMVALPIAMWRATGDAAWTAALTAIETAPYLLFGLPAGALADRLPRRAVMGATGIAAACIIATLAAFGTGSPWLLIIASAAASSLFVFSDAAGFGLLPELVARRDIATAVGQSTAASTVITIAGPALAGMLVGLVDVRLALFLDAALVAAGSLVLCALPRRPEVAADPAAHAAAPAVAPETAQAGAATTQRADARSLRTEIREGLAFLFSHRLVRSLTLLGIGNSLAGGMLLGLLVPVATARFSESGIGSDTSQVGLAYSALGVGTLLATAALPRLSRRVTPGVVTVGGLFSVAAGIAAWALTPHPLAGLVILAAYQAAASVVILNGITIRHLATPEQLQARVNTTARMIAWGGQPLGAAIAGALTAVLRPEAILAIAATTVAATALVAACGPLIAAGREFHAREQEHTETAG